MLEQRLRDREVIILDGATGTELQRRGAAMNGDAWCAVATRSHPDLLRAVHVDYIRAGADVITANTYASNRQMLEQAGLGDAVAELNTLAVEIALEAREQAAADRPVAVAGSMSTMMPMVAGSDNSDPTFDLSEAQARANYREIAGLLADSGVDLILMEMMYDRQRAQLAVEAAVATGLPVWVGFSCEATPDGLRMFHRDGALLADTIAPIMAVGGSVAGIMHSEVEVTGPAIEVLKRHWDGPISAYPESGYFAMPDWQFRDVITPRALAREAVNWIAAGAQIVGGCCGTSPAHIVAMRSAVPRRLD